MNRNGFTKLNKFKIKKDKNGKKKLKLPHYIETSHQIIGIINKNRLKINLYFFLRRNLMILLRRN